MKWLTFILLTALLFSKCLLAEETVQPYRTWTSSAGTSIEAQLVKRSSTDTVTLKREDGSMLTVGLRQLSEPDQQYLADLTALEGRPKGVLFIGNSYTRGIRQMLTGLIAASPYADCQLNYVHPGGKNLKSHLENDGTMEKIRQGNWDIVVLQDQSQTPAIFPEMFLEAARGIDRIIEASGAATVFYETWGRRDGDKQNAHRFPTYESMQAALTESYAKAARNCGARVAPVGQAWAILRKNDPKLGHQLYQGDGSHPAAPGAYLAACVIYATLFDADPAAVDFDGGLPEDHVRAIRTSVHQAIKKASESLPRK